MSDVSSNRQVLIASLPDGRLEPSDFTVVESAMPAAGDGKVLCRTVAVTIGAGQRAGLQGSASYAGAPEAGRVMGGSGIAQVVDSDDVGFTPGDMVRAPTGWQQYSVHSPDALALVDPTADPSHLLGPLGTNGLTAYFGLFDIGQVREGETVVVSAAAGSVGQAPLGSTTARTSISTTRSTNAPPSRFRWTNDEPPVGQLVAKDSRKSTLAPAASQVPAGDGTRYSDGGTRWKEAVEHAELLDL